MASYQRVSEGNGAFGCINNNNELVYTQVDDNFKPSLIYKENYLKTETTILYTPAKDFHPLGWWKSEFYFVENLDTITVVRKINVTNKTITNVCILGDNQLHFRRDINMVKNCVSVLSYPNKTQFILNINIETLVIDTVNIVHYNKLNTFYSLDNNVSYVVKDEKNENTKNIFLNDKKIKKIKSKKRHNIVLFEDKIILLYENDENTSVFAIYNHQGRTISKQVIPFKVKDMKLFEDGSKILMTVENGSDFFDSKQLNPDIELGLSFPYNIVIFDIALGR